MRYPKALAFAAAVLGALASQPASPAPAPVPAEIPVALLVDLSNGQTLYSREAERRFMPASVTKVMTAYTAFKLIDEGELHPGQRFLYTPELEDEWYAEGSNMFLRAGEQPTVGQLLLGITTVSGNDASVALAIAATGSLDNWLDLMNANAEAIGMHNTHFGSANGYPDGGQTYTSARDLALLAEAMTRDYPLLYRRYFGHRTLRWRNLTQANHDPVTGFVDGADGMKTGYTREAGFTFLGSAERDGRRLAMVLAGAPDSDLRDETAREFLEWGFSDFEQHRLIPAGTQVGTALVQDGSERRVALRTPVDVIASLPVGEAEAQVTMEVIYRGPVTAPIAAGDTIARLQVSIDGELVLEMPLEAARSVSKANVLQRIVNAVTKWTA